jgi:hypothetical protein
LAGGASFYAEEMAVASGEDKNLQPKSTSGPDETELRPKEGAAPEPAEQATPGFEQTVAFESLTPEAVESLQTPGGDSAAGEARDSAPSDVAPAEAAPSEATEVYERPTPVEGELPDATVAAEGEAATEVYERPMPVEGELPDATVAAEGEKAPEGEAAAEGEEAAEGELKAEEEQAEKAEEEEEVEKGPGVLARLGAWIADTSVYNVLLFLAVVALVLGSLALYQELKSYNWDIKAREAKRPVAAAGVDYGPPSTMAVA